MNLLVCFTCRQFFASYIYLGRRKTWEYRREGGSVRAVHVGYELDRVCPAVCEACGGREWQESE